MIEQLFQHMTVDVGAFASAAGARLSFAPSERTALHFVVEGSGVLRLGARHAHRLDAGALAVVSRRHAHQLQSAAPGLRLISGHVRAFSTLRPGLFDRLGGAVVVDFAGSAHVRGLFEALVAEQEHPMPGGRLMQRALAVECLVRVIRRLCAPTGQPPAWLLAAEDERLAPALDAILEAPERPHTVESLAVLTHMSRSVFARRFAECYGETPLSYVRAARLKRGADLLSGTDLSVGAVAAEVRFASRSHFSHAFRGHFGVTAAAYRRRYSTVIEPTTCHAQ
jgi:AraC-like DNA-binding protein